MSEALPAEMVSAWGWRIPLFLWLFNRSTIFVLHRKLEETPEFLVMKHHPTAREVFASTVASCRTVILSMMIAMLTSTTFYFVNVHTPTLGKHVLQLSSQNTLLVTLLLVATNFIWNSIGGAISDKIGRKPALLTIAGLALVTVYPALPRLVTEPSFGKMLAVEMMFSFYFGTYSGAMLALWSKSCQSTFAQPAFL
ncbi:nitrate/nitrite transporter NarK [Bradyrhizobium sp. RT9b]